MFTKEIQNFVREVNLLDQEIEKRRKAAGELYRQSGQVPPEKIPLEFVEMEDLHERLVNLLITVHVNWRYFSRLNMAIVDQIRGVYLAGICQLIKSEHYVSSWHRTYEEQTGMQVDYTVRDCILEPAFRQEGLLPEDWGETSRRNFKDVLVKEAGIPANLVAKMLRFFELYWKYFRGTDYACLTEILESDTSSSQLYVEYNDLLEIRHAYSDLKEFPSKIQIILRQMGKIAELLEITDIEGHELSDPENQKYLNDQLGFNMFNILPRRDSLQKFYARLWNYISPAKLRMIFKRKPPSTAVTCPDKKKRQTGSYRDIQLGRHQVGHIVYNVVPNSSLTFEEILRWPRETIQYVGNQHIGYISGKPFEVYIGEFSRDRAYPFYYLGKLRGYVWYGSIPRGLPLKVDGHTIFPAETVSWNPYLSYFWDNDKRRYRLMVRIPTLSLFRKDLCGREVVVSCDGSTVLRKIVIPQSGCREMEGIEFYLDEALIQQCGETLGIFITAQEEKPIEIAHTTIAMPPVILFSTASKRVIPPGSYSYGDDRLVLFILLPLNCVKCSSPEAVLEREYQPFGAYMIRKLKWSTPNLVLECSLEYKWSFDQPVTLYIKQDYDRETGDSIHSNSVPFNERQFELVTNLPSEELEKVHLHLAVDGMNPRMCKLTEMLSEDLTFTGRGLAEKLRLPGGFAVRAEISLMYRNRSFCDLEVFVFPSITVVPLKELYLEGDQVEVTLASEAPCFGYLSEIQNETRLFLGIAEFTEEDGAMVPKQLLGEVSLPALRCTYPVSFTPPVFSMRVVNREGESSRKTKISRNEALTSALELFGPMGSAVLIDYPGMQERVDFGPIGRWQKPIAEFLGALKDEVSIIYVQCNGLKTKLEIDWFSQIYSFSSETGEVDDEAAFTLAFEGPPTSSVAVIMVDESGLQLGQRILACPGERSIVRDVLEVPAEVKGEHIILKCFYMNGDELDEYGEIRLPLNKEAGYTVRNIQKDLRKLAFLAKRFAKEELLVGD